MGKKSLRYALFAGAALLCSPEAAVAQSSSDLEMRVQELEKALAAVRAELADQKAKSAADTQRIIEVEKRPAPSAPVDGFKVADATLKIGGYVKAEAIASAYGDGDTATNALGRDFYLPQSIPVGAAAAKEDVDFDAHAKQTRLWLSAARSVSAHTLGAYVEGDFQSAPGTQGSERTSNAYDFALRRAYVTYDNWLFGQDWSTFMNVAVLPETPDFIGPTEGTVFVRQAMVRYTHKLGDKAAFVFALENPETAYVTTSSAAIQEPDDDSLPDAIVRLNLAHAIGDFTLAGVARQLNADTATTSSEAFGWGLTASGKLKLGARDDLRVMVSGGEGIGRYLGLNLGPDAVLSGADLDTVSAVAGFAALRHFWSPNVRSTFMVSGQSIDGVAGMPLAANEMAWSGAANLFYSPVKGFDLGLEYRHAERETFDGLSGSLDRVHLVAKQAF